MTQTLNEQMDPDFVDRTLKLIEEYDEYCKERNISENEDLKFTLLINCLLGLIIFVYDRKEKIKHILSKKLNEIRLFNDIEIENKQSISLKKFLCHFRNGIAHSHIEAVIIVGGNNLRECIEFRDEYPPGSGNKSFEKTKLSYKNIKEITKYISMEYSLYHYMIKMNDLPSHLGPGTKLLKEFIKNKDYDNSLLIVKDIKEKWELSTEQKKFLENLEKEIIELKEINGNI